MKAAFLFSGQLRGFNHCLPNIQKYLFDVFEESDTFVYCPKEDLSRLNELLQLNPKVMHFEEDFFHTLENLVDNNNQISYSKDSSEKNGYKSKGRMQHYFIQWYGVKKVYEMMEDYAKYQNKIYDIVFRIRFDTCPKTPLNLEEIKLDHINVPDFQHWFGIHDRFACGNMENMKVYCHKYDHMIFNNMGNGNCESRMLQHLNNHKVKINKINFYYTRLHQDGSLQS